MSLPDQSLPGEQTAGVTGLFFSDWLLLIAFCVCVFGISLVSGRPLTMHEGVLPQSSREMYVDHDWVIPKNGGRPWLESPPLPQWITVGIASVIGRCDEVWIVRIGPLLAATWIVCLTAWMMSGWFGRVHGLISGAILATTYEFTQYAWLAEDEIFLAALVATAMAAFVRGEFFRQEPTVTLSSHFFGKRPGGLLLFYAALGLTNLAKGLLFGTAMVVVPIAGYLLWNADRKRIAYYCWFWGWLVFAAVAGAWPLLAINRYPDVIALWSYDHVGRLNGNYVAITEPVWYYAQVLPSLVLPWTPLCFAGFALTAATARNRRFSAERLIWCWAILPPIVFSIPSGKHHHYLLHCLAPWAMLATPALIAARTWTLTWPAWTRNPAFAACLWGTLAAIAAGAFNQLIASLTGETQVTSAIVSYGPIAIIAGSAIVAAGLAGLITAGLYHRRSRIAAATLFAFVACGFIAGHCAAGWYFDKCRQDTEFLLAARNFEPASGPVYVNTATSSLDEFRIQFYLKDRSRPLHNLSFLNSAQIVEDEVLLIARSGERARLAELGDVQQLLQSKQTRRERSPDDRWTLFRVSLPRNRNRFPVDGIRISPMQTAQREQGPYVGPSRF